MLELKLKLKLQARPWPPAPIFQTQLPALTTADQCCPRTAPHHPLSLPASDAHPGASDILALSPTVSSPLALTSLPRSHQSASARGGPVWSVQLATPAPCPYIQPPPSPRPPRGRAAVSRRENCSITNIQWPALTDRFRPRTQPIWTQESPHIIRSLASLYSPARASATALPWRKSVML